MPILNPDHLLEQAERLIAKPPAGAPRQVDLRRAISSAYYGVFHAVLAAAADQVVGSTKRASRRYALVYRSVTHSALRDLCYEARRQRPSSRYGSYVPSGFGPDLKAFADALIDLQEKRHSADHDPGVRVKTTDASLAIARARSALTAFGNAPPDLRQTFLTLVLFPPR